MHPSPPLPPSQEAGEHIFRMKGILAIRHAPCRYVYHAVHMMFDGAPHPIPTPSLPSALTLAPARTLKLTLAVTLA